MVDPTVAQISVEKEDRGARARILAAAEEVFAQYGYDGGSLRKVAHKADVPVGLVSYHFKGKFGLYRAVFEARVPSIVEQRLAGLALADLETDPDRKLELVVKSLLVPMLRLRLTEQGRKFAQLLFREVMDPASAERDIIRSLINPVSEAFMTRFREMLPDRTDVSVDWGYGAMMGAMLYIVGGGGRLKSVTQGRADPDDVQAATENLVSFVLAGLRRGLPGSPIPRSEQAVQS
jgi:AcrR family transcriptional regulator